MLSEPVSIQRVMPLQLLSPGRLSSSISVYRARYQRSIPPHYLINPLTHELIDVNVLMVRDGILTVPTQPRTNFANFYHELSRRYPDLFQQVLSPSGAAKGASTRYLTPIKEITGYHLADLSLPGDDQLYGWFALEEETALLKHQLEVFFQGNGLYFNRGSAFYDGHTLMPYPDQFLAEYLEGGAAFEVRQRLAVDDESLMRPLLFFVTGEDYQMSAFLFEFEPGERYSEGIRRCETVLRTRQARAAMAASPPLVVPGQDGQPIYLSLEEMIGQFHANDIRHSLYCPYRGMVLLSAELSRAQCLQPDRLARSLSGQAGDRVYLRLRETLNYLTVNELMNFLDERGYRGRYMRTGGAGGAHLMWINPLEGIYSFLVPFLTRAGQFGIIQTSGTHGNITGNDGPTIRQLSAILRDLNDQPPFNQDPIIAAVSGSQGNDVLNVVCRSYDGFPGLLSNLDPQASLDDKPVLRGAVTTPRVGISVRRSV